MDGLIAEARGGVDVSQLHQVVGGKAGFFRQLASGAGVRVFAFVQFARRDFQERFFHRIAILPHKEDAAVIGHGNHRCRAGMEHHFAPGFISMDFHIIIIDVEHAPFENRSALQKFFFFDTHFTPVLPTPPVRLPSAWSSSVVKYFVKIPWATRSPLFTWNGSSLEL